MPIHPARPGQSGGAFVPKSSEVVISTNYTYVKTPIEAEKLHYTSNKRGSRRLNHPVRVSCFVAFSLLCGCTKYISPQTPEGTDCIQEVEDRARSCRNIAREEVDLCYRERELTRQLSGTRGVILENGIFNTIDAILDPIGSLSGKYDRCKAPLHKCDREYDEGWKECGGVIK